MIAGILIPYISFAAAYATPNLWPSGFWGPLVSCTGNYLSGRNPCTNLCDLIGTAINIIYFAMSIGIFIAAPVLFVAGGIMMMIAGPNPGMLDKAKKLFTGTLVGLLIILCSYLIINTFVTVVGIQGVGGFLGNAACTIQ